MSFSLQHASDKIARTVREIALEGFADPGAPKFASRSHYAALSAAGSQIWLDTGDRAAAESVWGAEVSGLTTNNTLVNQVIQTGAMDNVIRASALVLREAKPGLTIEEMVFELGIVANARIALDLVETFGVSVSVELHPSVANDVDATYQLAFRYHEISPERFIIKVPLTAAGYIAVRRLSKASVPVNFTLGFSARQNLLAALFSRPRYVNTFLGRLNQVVVENKMGDGANVGERATIASQRALKEALGPDAARSTYQIAASLRSAEQVIVLAGVDVQTIPPKVAAEFLAMDVGDLAPVDGSDLPVRLAEDLTIEETGLNTLWEISDEFRNFVADAAASGDSASEPEVLRALAERRGITDFLRNWAPDELSRIRAAGKIPQLKPWRGITGLDDLMSAAALESFAEDQAALDARIARLAASA